MKSFSSGESSGAREKREATCDTLRVSKMHLFSSRILPSEDGFTLTH